MKKKVYYFTKVFYQSLVNEEPEAIQQYKAMLNDRMNNHLVFFSYDDVSTDYSYKIIEEV